MFELFDIINYLILLIIAVLGVLVILNNWKSINNRVFFVVLLASLGWILSLQVAFYYVDLKSWDFAYFFMRLAFGFSIFGTFLMTIFLYYFPRKSITFPRVLKWAYLIFSIILSLLASFTPLVTNALVIDDMEYVRDSFGPFHLVYVAAMMLNLIIAIYLSIKKYNTSTGITKNKMGFVLVGYLSFVSFAIMTNVILPLFDMFVFQGQSQLLIVLFIIPAFFAIYKYRFFNFSYFTFNLFRNFSIYSLYLLLTVFFINLFDASTVSIHPSISHPTSALLALLIFDWIRKRLPIFLTGDLKKIRRVIVRLKEKINNSEDYKALQDLLEESFIGKLHFDKVTLFAIRKGKDIDIPVYEPDRFTSILKRYKKDALIRGELEFRKMNDRNREILAETMDELGVDFCMPLFSEKSLVGLVVMKKSRGDLSFSSQEINEILSCRKDLSIGLMNILLKMNLQEENNLMKSIIDEKTKELKNKVKEINEMLKQQSDFISVTAHEFRTPLSIAAFQLEEIFSSTDDLNKQREDLKVIDYTIHNLKELTERLFTIQQYDLNKVELNPEDVDVKKLIKKVFNEFSPIMDEKNIKFSLKIDIKNPVLMPMDSLQMRQVLHNLLKNASKFTPQKGEVVLGLSQKNESIFIGIQDNGAGVPNDLKESIFEKFRTQSPGSGAGIGLGLYLCKKIVELHGGKLWVEDGKKSGAHFIIQLSTKKPTGVARAKD